MFGNVGKVIKTVSKVSFMLVSILFEVMAGFLFIEFEEPLFLIIAIVGPIAAWIFSCFIYAYGDIVCNLREINEKIGKCKDESCDSENDIEE